MECVRAFLKVHSKRVEMEFLFRGGGGNKRTKINKKRNKIPIPFSK